MMNVLNIDQAVGLTINKAYSQNQQNNEEQNIILINRDESNTIVDS